jgi:hypothetical protein
MGTPPQADHYSATQTETPIHEYENLSEDAQQIIENASSSGSTTVEDVPGEFRTAREGWNFVRDDGETLCIRIREDGSTNVRNCHGIAFEYADLSDKGQWAVSLTINNSESVTMGGVKIRQDPPEEFTPEGIYMGDRFTPPGLHSNVPDGYSYVLKNGTVYEFFVIESDGFSEEIGNIIGDALFVIGGIAIGVMGMKNYYKSRVWSATLVLVVTPVFILYPLARPILSDTGRYQLVYWLNQQPLFVIGGVLFVLASISVLASAESLEID